MKTLMGNKSIKKKARNCLVHWYARIAHWPWWQDMSFKKDVLQFQGTQICFHVRKQTI